ncbi:hypothetical protein CEXT_809641 [Caerostris extrusa]|uniref:Uncharacterized protein n=1 Tax=Caerostris extrusa TaxID=172846 RepID=A0AAV4MCA3_CAEEX|nr:hypothetical protein CEXT_809641 [Caerostris extrusa]
MTWCIELRRLCQKLTTDVYLQAAMLILGRLNKSMGKGRWDCGIRNAVLFVIQGWRIQCGRVLGMWLIDLLGGCPIRKRMTAANDKQFRSIAGIEIASHVERFILAT